MDSHCYGINPKIIQNAIQEYSFEPGNLKLAPLKNISLEMLVGDEAMVMVHYNRLVTH